MNICISYLHISCLQEAFPRTDNIVVGKREKMLVTNIFSISHNVSEDSLKAGGLSD